MTVLTRKQAKLFILSKQGLLGSNRFSGKDGAYAYVRQAGCIQYDPVDVCGKNAELTLQSRVKGFRKSMLDDLLYRDRLLVDYPDKELSIWPAEDWPYFSQYRERSPGSVPASPDLPNWSRKHCPMFAKTVRFPATRCRSAARSSGIPPCIGAATGIKNQKLPVPSWNSCTQTVSLSSTTKTAHGSSMIWLNAI